MLSFMSMIKCNIAGRSPNKAMWSGLNVAPLTRTVVMDQISATRNVSFGALLWLLDLLLERCTDSFQDRQVPLEEHTTEWSHVASHLLCHKDLLWSNEDLCDLSGGPLRCLVLPDVNMSKLELIIRLRSILNLSGHTSVTSVYWGRG